MHYFFYTKSRKVLRNHKMQPTIEFLKFIFIKRATFILTLIFVFTLHFKFSGYFIILFTRTWDYFAYACLIMVTFMLASFLDPIIIIFQLRKHFKGSFNRHHSSITHCFSNSETIFSRLFVAHEASYFICGALHTRL